jgi:hypothetical protein
MAITVPGERRNRDAPVVAPDEEVELRAGRHHAAAVADHAHAVVNLAGRKAQPVELLDVDGLAVQRRLGPRVVGEHAERDQRHAGPGAPRRALGDVDPARARRIEALEAGLGLLHGDASDHLGDRLVVDVARADDIQDPARQPHRALDVGEEQAALVDAAELAPRPVEHGHVARAHLLLDAVLRDLAGVEVTRAARRGAQLGDDALHARRPLRLDPRPVGIAGRLFTLTSGEPAIAGPTPGCGHAGQPCASGMTCALSPRRAPPGISDPPPTSLYRSSSWPDLQQGTEICLSQR